MSVVHQTSNHLPRNTNLVSISVVIQVIIFYPSKLPTADQLYLVKQLL